LDKLEAEHKKTTLSLDALTDELKTLKAGNARSTKDLEQVQDEKETVQRDLEGQQALLLQAEAESKAEVEAAVAKLEMELVAKEALQKELELVQTEKEAAQKSLEEQCARLVQAEAESKSSVEAAGAKLEVELLAKEALQKDLARELKAVEDSQAELAREKQQVEEGRARNKQLEHEKREEVQRASEEATAFIDAEKTKLQDVMHRKLQEGDRANAVDMEANAQKHTRAVEALAGELKSSKAEACELQQEAEKLTCTLEAEREQSKQALSNERSEKEALLKEKMEEAAKHNEEALAAKKMLEEKGENEDVEEIRDQMHKAELEAAGALAKEAEAEAARQASESKLEEVTGREEILKADLIKLQTEDRRIRKEEKARLAEVQESEKNLQAQVTKLGFAEKKAQMFESNKNKAESSNRELKQEIAQLKEQVAAAHVDAHKLHEFEQTSKLRDEEVASCQEQSKGLLLTLRTMEQDWEMVSAENNSLKASLCEFEAALDGAANDNAKLASHSNHKQKLQYVAKIKEENSGLKQDLMKAHQRLAQFEAGQRGSSLLEALAAFGGGSGGVTAEQSVCGQSVCSTRGCEPRTPNPKGAASQAARTPHRPDSRGPQSARRGSATEVENCQNCAFHERASERTIVDFQHFLTLIERAAFAGDVGEAGSADSSTMLEKLRGVVATGASQTASSTAAPQTPNATRTAWPASEEAASPKA